MRRGLAIAVLLAVAARAPAAEAPEAPPLDRQAREAYAAGVEFLLGAQNEDGSWGHHAQARPYAIWAPVPGAHRSFRVATTSLCLMALLDLGDGDERVVGARRRALRYLVAHARVKRSHGSEIYVVWAYAYGLQALARSLARGTDGVPEEEVRERAESLVRALALYQTVDGGWGYFDFNAQTYRPSGVSMSFMTATGLIAMHEAREVGIRLPPATLQKALRSLERTRTPEQTYVYSFNWRYHPQGDINRPQGSLTRRPACDLALHLFDRGIDRATLRRGVEVLLEKRAFGRMALHRTVPHESWFGVSAYFYLYGYFSAAEVCRVLGAEATDAFREGLLREILYVRHPDGSFWDFPFYGYDKPYGTAYALLALRGLTSD